MERRRPPQRCGLSTVRWRYAIWLTLTQQGYDPRDFILYGFGGAGGIHAAAIARELGMARAVIPLSDLAAGWSAFGITASEALIAESDAVSMTSPFDPAEIIATGARSSARSGQAFCAGHRARRDPTRLPCRAALRASNNQVPIEVEGGAYDADAVKQMVTTFEREYERLYGKGAGYAAAGFQLTNLEVRGRAALTDVALESIGLSETSDTNTIKSHREVRWLGGPARTVVYDGPRLAPGSRITGPAIIEFPDTTVVIDDRSSVEIHVSGQRCDRP
jgi:N-methylhydantoinase A